LAKKMPYGPEVIDLSEIVAEVLSLVRHEATTRQVQIQTNMASDLPHVQGDRIQLRQVLLNLVVNGMEAIATIEPSKRAVVISGRRESHDNEEWCLITVQDSGPGVKPDEVDRLFEAFYTTKPQGMGMGLAISRSIIEFHGGKLWAETEQGLGAKFLFRLPTERGEKL
jgi:signal transduction histidine kinase